MVCQGTGKPRVFEMKVNETARLDLDGSVSSEVNDADSTDNTEDG